jgi:hypothetical protein
MSETARRLVRRAGAALTAVVLAARPADTDQLSLLSLEIYR